MKRKNLVAMGLAGVMAVGMCMPVMAAADTNKVDSAPGSMATEVTLQQDVKYAIEIPAKLELTAGTPSVINFTLSQGGLLEPDKTVTIKAPADAIKLTHTVKDTVKQAVVLKDDKDTAIIAGADVAKFTADGTTLDVTSVKLAVDGNMKYAGTYKGNVTFTVAYDGTVPVQP